MSEISRRELFGLAKRVAIGAGTGAALIPASAGAVELVEGTSDYTAGNAHITEKAQKQCTERGLPEEDCVSPDSMDFSNMDKVRAVIEAPIGEEWMFRGIPSALTDLSEGNREDIVDNFLRGADGGFRFTRGELIAGAVSTLIFGAAHNLTDDGFATKNIPSPQILSGATFWILQRRFGFLANVSSHATLNAIAVSWPAPDNGKK